MIIKACIITCLNRNSNKCVSEVQNSYCPKKAKTIMIIFDWIFFSVSMVSRTFTSIAFEKVLPFIFQQAAEIQNGLVLRYKRLYTFIFYRIKGCIFQVQLAQFYKYFLEMFMFFLLFSTFYWNPLSIELILLTLGLWFVDKTIRKRA